MDNLEFPDIYGDNAQVTLGNHGAALTFFLSEPLDEDPKGRAVVRVRMSMELARALAKLLAEQLLAVDKLLKQPEEGDDSDGSSDREQTGVAS